MISNRIIKRTNHFKTKFLRSVGHDIRNYNNAIKGLSELLLQNKSQTKTDTRYIQTIINQAQEIDVFIKDILDIKQAEKGDMELGETKLCDVAMIIKEIELLNKAKSLADNIKITNDLQKDLPKIKCDPRRLKQILMNLVTNAIKYSPNNSSVKIAAEISDDEKMICVKISDQGLGMDEKEITMALDGNGSKINKSNLNKTIDSHGIGLTIVKHLVELHDGILNINSIKGKGTTIIIKLPVAQEHSNKPNIANVINHNIKILIIDDIGTNLSINKSIVTKAFQNIVCDTSLSAKTGIDIFKKAHDSRRPYDIIITDIQMPEISGLELGSVEISN